MQRMIAVVTVVKAQDKFRTCLSHFILLTIQRFHIPVLFMLTITISITSTKESPGENETDRTLTISEIYALLTVRYMLLHIRILLEWLNGLRDIKFIPRCVKIVEETKNRSFPNVSLW